MGCLDEPQLMPSNFPPFTDLLAVARKLESTSKSSKLRRYLDQAWRANSCLGDLQQTEDCCDVLRGMVGRSKADDTHQILTTERALLANGLSLYARATSTSGQNGERGSIQLEHGSMTKGQWEDHRLVVDVRNQALSHVYDARPIGSQHWHRSSFFAVEASPGKWRPASASNQTTFNKAAFEALTRATPIAFEIVKQKFFKRMRSVMQELSETSCQALLRECRFDPIDTFGSREAVQSVLDMEKAGMGAMWSRE